MRLSCACAELHGAQLNGVSVAPSYSQTGLSYAWIELHRGLVAQGFS